MEDLVIDQLTRWAAQTAAVRLLLLVGSRARPDATLDDWSDYDVTVFADDLPALLTRENEWTARFGPVLLNLPEQGSLNGERSPARLVQYTDGTKIDFGLYATAQLDALLASTTLPDWIRAGYRILVDKDGRTAALERASARPPVRPVLTEAAYRAIVTEFFWELFYIVKNLQRGEPWLAQYSWHVIRQRALLPLLEWYARTSGVTDTAVQPQGRKLRHWLPDPYGARAHRVFCGVGATENWSALRETVTLFREVATALADRAGFVYPAAVDRRVMEILGERGAPVE